MRERFPELGDFFWAYFFQDWYMEYDSPEEAIRSYVEEHAPEVVANCLRQLRELLALDLDDASLERTLIEDLRCGYYPLAEGKTYRQWLDWVGRELAIALDTVSNSD